MATRATTIVICLLAAAVGGYLLFTQPTEPATSSQDPAVTSTSPASTSPGSPSPPANTGAPATTEPTTSTAPATTPATTSERREVERFTVTFMKAFAKPSRKVSYRQWWAKVASMLTDEAVDTYAGISPTVVPFRKVTGPVTLEAIDPDSDAFWIQPVQIGTDSGTYRLLVQLRSAGFSDRLLVIEIQEP